MTARCLQCATILIPEAAPRSDELQGIADVLDMRIAMGYGALIGTASGFGIWALMSGDDASAKVFVVVFAAVGSGLGRLYAHAQNKL